MHNNNSIIKTCLSFFLHSLCLLIVLVFLIFCLSYIKKRNLYHEVPSFPNLLIYLFFFLMMTATAMTATTIIATTITFPIIGFLLPVFNGDESFPGSCSFVMMRWYHFIVSFCRAFCLNYIKYPSFLTAPLIKWNKTRSTPPLQAGYVISHRPWRSWTAQ